MATPHKAALTLAAIASIALVSPAHAKERSERVQYSDLDLSTAEGQQTFKSRVMRAVRSVCVLPTAKTASELMDRNRCEMHAKATAMRKVGQTIALYPSNVKVALDY